MSKNIVGIIYILKLNHPLGNHKHRAWYYIGWTLDLEERLAEHRAGRAAAFTRAAVERGFRFEVVATIRGTRCDERKLKRRKNTRRIVEQIEKGTFHL